MTKMTKSQLASLRAAPQPQEQIVSTYTKRDGSRWNKVRVGWNQYVHRQVAG